MHACISICMLCVFLPKSVSQSKLELETESNASVPHNLANGRQKAPFCLSFVAACEDRQQARKLGCQQASRQTGRRADRGIQRKREGKGEKGRADNPHSCNE